MKAIRLATGSSSSARPATFTATSLREECNADHATRPSTQCPGRLRVLRQAVSQGRGRGPNLAIDKRTLLLFRVLRRRCRGSLIPKKQDARLVAETSSACEPIVHDARLILWAAVDRCMSVVKSELVQR